MLISLEIHHSKLYWRTSVFFNSLPDVYMSGEGAFSKSSDPTQEILL